MPCSARVMAGYSKRARCFAVILEEVQHAVAVLALKALRVVRRVLDWRASGGRRLWSGQLTRDFPEYSRIVCERPTRDIERRKRARAEAGAGGGGGGSHG